MRIDTCVSPTPTDLTSASSYLAMTMRLADPTSDMLVRHVRLLRDCVASAQAQMRFEIEAAVVLPSQLQLLCAFDDPNMGARGAAQLICRTFQRHAADGASQGNGPTIWEDEVEMVQITAPTVALRRTFMENAPVRAGLVRCATDWPFSSAVRGAGLGAGRAVA